MIRRKSLLIIEDIEIFRMVIDSTLGQLGTMLIFRTENVIRLLLRKRGMIGVSRW